MANFNNHSTMAASARIRSGDGRSGGVQRFGTASAFAEVPPTTGADSIVFRLSLDEHRDLLQKVTRARALKPSAKLLLAATCSGALMLAELIAVISAGINSIARIPSLTPREHQVLCEIRSGLTNREIAAVLGISLSTANRHVENILRKLSVRNRAQAVAKCESIGSEQAGKVAVH